MPSSQELDPLTRLRDLEYAYFGSNDFAQLLANNTVTLA